MKPRHKRCPCRRKKAIGCKSGECLCNREAHPRSGHMLAIFCEWKGHHGEALGIFPIKNLRWGGFRTVILDPSRVVTIKSDR